MLLQMVSCGKPRLDFTFPNLIFFFRPEPHVSEHCGLSPSDARDKGLLTSVAVAMANGTREGHVGDSSPLRAHVPLSHVCSPGSVDARCSGAWLVCTDMGVGFFSCLFPK